MATTPPTQFHHFPSLPYELRLKIYHILLNEPRNVKINGKRPIMKISRKRYLETYTTTTPIPPLLHSSQETRAEALTYYRAHFRSEHSPSYIYVNFERDTIQLADGVMAYLSGEELKGIRRLHLQVEDAAYFGHYNLGMLAKMRGLREVELVGLGEDAGTWQSRGHYFRGMVRELREMRREDPFWDCPRVRIVHADSGEEFAVVEGGVWTEADEDDEDD
ncbi:2c95f05e-8a0c-4daa-a541-6c5a7d7ff779-CDS [Sclerotinia trifoliorum]|uniref:2c95f05e-8a0c-4daa-a541-6c5a7d7ff779-CDS n=1 Tax=Sclerotinia trifoliorum TaxID=28548 RepID=A0A8H2VVJ0_9HELO|nr:2c95f05e-8a0c-4daa-a541-6c5a7d7ff779-CDS [Sclerotinia trifoliorum]